MATVSNNKQYSTLLYHSLLKSIHTASASTVFTHSWVIERTVSFSFLKKITHHFFGKSLKTNGADFQPSQSCCSGDSNQQMVVSLILVIIVMMAMMMTIIAAAENDNYSCRWGMQGGGNVYMRMCVWMQTPECLGNHQRKGPGRRTSLLQGPLPEADPLISGNKGGRATNSSKIAWGVGGVEGCRESDAMPHSARISCGQSGLNSPPS